MCVRHWRQSWTLRNNRCNIKSEVINLARINNWSNWYLDEWGYAIWGPTLNQGNKWPTYAEGRHHSSLRFDSAGLSGALYNEHIHLGKLGNVLRQIRMCQHCCRQVLWQLCALAREVLWRGIIQSVQLMWRRQDSCIMPDWCSVRPDGRRRI